jgi:hypothetical protein
MLLASCLRKFHHHFSRQVPRQRQGTPLRLEFLESRTVPTILFDNATTATVSDGGGPVITHPDVDLIFWGSGWNSAQTLMNNVISSVDTIMNSPFLTGLTQYRGVGNGQFLRTDLITSTSPAAQTAYAQYAYFVQANLNNGTLSVTPGMDSQILYMVIPQPGTTDPADNLRGDHSYYFSNFGRFHYGFTENINNLDDITTVFSHELAEAATDPEGTAFQVNPRDPTYWNEIGDGEAKGYTYRLDGVLVQSTFSQADHAYDVYDGNTQQFLVNGTVGLPVLTINGDQLANPDDTVIVDAVGGGYLVTLNGEVVQFDPGKIGSITVNTLSGDDTLNIERTMRTLRPVAVTVNLGDNNNTVNLSPMAQDLSNLVGTVTINGGAGTDTLNLFDQESTSNSNYTVASSNVAASGMAPVTYHNLAALTLNASNGTDTISAPSTPAGTAVTINGGSGTDTLVGSAADNTWSLTGSNTGTLSSASIAGPVSFTAVQNLIGGTANNTFVFSDGAGISGNLDGGSGGSLDYSAYSSSVLVNLQTATATGVGGSIAHIQSVIGGTGGGPGVYDILVGNGSNTLIGGNGRRNLLIAGASPSTLRGGDDDDLLIGGTTAYDQNPDALVAIMDYWSGTSDDYATRVSNLFSGNGVPLLDPSTVTSNGGGNTLMGGPGLNLYYGNDSDTTDFDPNSGAVFISV